MSETIDSTTAAPDESAAVLVLGDGSVFHGQGIGARGQAVGEVCFTTGMTGYQETLTDPSFAGQIITFTFPHVGNVGTNEEDMESRRPAARGVVLAGPISEPANWRAREHLDDWLREQGLIGICGIDTRRLTRHIRDNGAPNGVIIHGKADIAAALELARTWPGLAGMDLAREVTCEQSYEWDQTVWDIRNGYGHMKSPRRHVVAIDYGAKWNILRNLAASGCRVSVVPATMAARDILAMKPDGIFLSNGPGDPAATGEYALPILRELIASGVPIFGICLGHQLLALAFGARTEKMHRGHRGANQPVKDLSTGKVEITSQNHGFAVLADSLPENCEATHISLFDGSLEGFRATDKPVFAVQYHPEASPGPHDSHYLFNRFCELMDSHAQAH